MPVASIPAKAIAAIALCAATLFTTSCTTPTPKPLTTVSPNSQSSSLHTTPATTTSSTPSPPSAPTVTITKKTLAIDDPYPIDVSAETPVLSGVSDDVANAFALAFAKSQKDETRGLAEVIASVGAKNLGAGCHGPNRGGTQVSTLNATTTATIYKNRYATGMTVWQHGVGCATTGYDYDPTSVTIDLATGKTAKLATFVKTSSPSFRQAIITSVKKTCRDIVIDASGAPFTTHLDAWSPTATGLILSWHGERISPRSCRSVKVTIPWKEATATAARCPTDVKPPSGIDPQVCGPAPSKLVELKPPNMFTLPSRNIACEINSNTVLCYIKEYTFKPARDPGNPPNNMVVWVGSEIYIHKGKAAIGEYDTEPGPAANAAWEGGSITILGYGKTTAIGRIACTSQTTGLTCWDTSTHHGFLFSKSKYVIW